MPARARGLEIKPAYTLSTAVRKQTDRQTDTRYSTNAYVHLNVDLHAARADAAGGPSRMRQHRHHRLAVLSLIRTCSAIVVRLEHVHVCVSW